MICKVNNKETRCNDDGNDNGEGKYGVDVDYEAKSIFVFSDLINGATKTTYECCWKVFLILKSRPGFIVSLDYSLINI